MDLEPRKAVNMAEEKKRKIKNVTIAVKLTVYVVVALHVVEISVFVFVLNVVISLVSVMIIVCIVAMIHVFVYVRIVATVHVNVYVKNAIQPHVTAQMLILMLTLK
jgi:hypothetical protein